MTRYTTKVRISGDDLGHPVRSSSQWERVNDHWSLRVIATAVEPGSITLDQRRAWIGAEAELEVNSTSGGQQRTAPKVKGYVRAVDGNGDVVALEIASHDTRLDLVPRTRSFENQGPIELFQNLCDAEGVDLDVANAGQPATRPFLAQHDETDFRLLMRLASAEGLICFDHEGTWTVLQQPDATAPLRLEVTDLIRRGQARTEPAPFAHAARRLGYQPAQDVCVTSQAFQPPTAGLGGDACEAAARRFQDLPADQHATPTDDPNAVAKLLEHRARTSLARSALVTFSTRRVDVALGACIQVSGLDHVDPEEKLVVVEQRREIREGSFESTITAAPIDFVAAHPGPMHRLIPGLLEATVVDSADPDKLGRVRIRFPWDEKASVLARVAVAAAGKDWGSSWTPRKGSRVIVGFLEGNPDKPVIMGCAYDEAAPPKHEQENGADEILLLLTRNGSEIRMLEGSGEDELRIGAKGKALLRILVSESGTISIQAAEIRVKATQKLALEGGAVEIRADQNIQIDAPQISIG